MTTAVLLAHSGPTHRTSWLFLGTALAVTLLAIAVIFAGRRYGWLPRAPEEIGHLPRDQQRLVLRAVQRGEAVSDPALAPAAVAHADRASDRLERLRGRGWLAFGWGLGCLFSFIAVVDLVGDRDVAGALFQGFLAAIWIANPYLQRRLYQRARRSAQLNARLLRTP